MQLFNGTPQAARAGMTVRHAAVRPYRSPAIQVAAVPQIGDALLFFDAKRDCLKLFLRDALGPDELQEIVSLDGSCFRRRLPDSPLSKLCRR